MTGVQTCALPIWRNTGGGTQTFQDLIRFAGERYSSQIQLYVEEATAEAAGNRYANLKGLYRPASWLYHLLTGGYLSDLYPEESRKDYFGRLPFYLQAELGDWSRTPSAYAREMDALCSDPELFAADSEEPAIRSPESLEREHEEQRLRQEEASHAFYRFLCIKRNVLRHRHIRELSQIRHIPVCKNIRPAVHMVDLSLIHISEEIHAMLDCLSAKTLSYPKGSFLFHYGDHRDLHYSLHSFPTRRSSDLGRIFLQTGIWRI